MRSKIISLLIISMLVIVSIGCSGSGGFSSPKAVFNKMVEKQADEAKANKMSAMAEFVAPDDRLVLAFTLDMMVGFMSFAKKDIAKEHKALREKYNLNEKTESIGKINQKDLQNLSKLREICQKIYGDIGDINVYIGEVEAIMDKLPGQKSKPVVKFKDISKLKIDGDSATATVSMENGTKKKMKFRKVNNNWYLDIDSLK